MTDSYDFTTLADTTSASSTLTALFCGMTIFASILSIIMIISYWKIFSKKGKPGWAILVPIYNVIVQIQVANLSMIYFLLLLIPFVNIYAIIKINISMAKSFGKSIGYGIGMIFLPIIFIPLLAFSDTKEESNNSGDINNFDAMNVINNGETNTNNQTFGIEPIQTVDINPAINNEIPIMENSVESNSNIENNTITTNQSENIQTISENVSNDNSTINPLENIPVMNENIINDNSINNNQRESIPTLESNVIEPNTVDNTISNDNIIDVNTVNNVEQTNNINLEAPVLNTNVNNEVLTPTIDTNINNNVETPIVNESNIETLDTNANSNVTAFNVKPVVDVEQTNTSENDNSTFNNAIQNDTTSTKKICKSCGSEMPDIVSICPVCGTDNE